MLDETQEMKQTVNVRNYQDSDLEACRGLWRELAEWHREIYSDPSIGGETPEFFFDMHLAKVGAERIWVAVVDEKVVGFIGIEIEKEEATVEPVIVSKAFRGQGIGRLLVEKAADEAQRRGLRHLNVEPVARNVEAIQFYYDIGFKTIGQVQLFIDLSGKKWKSTLKLQLHERDFEY